MFRPTLLYVPPSMPWRRCTNFVGRLIENIPVPHDNPGSDWNYSTNPSDFFRPELTYRRDH